MMITDSEDLLTEILLRLPAKSLIRFKLVCKTWLSLISSHHFSHLHTLHHRLHLCSRPESPPSLLLRLANTFEYFYLHNKKWIPHRFSPSLAEPTILSSSNGLFLLQCGDFKNRPMKDCYIYNPTTKQSRKILLSVNEKYGCVVGLNLVADPLESPHYKIVCVRAIRKRSSSLWRSWLRRCQIEVYESDSGSWKLFGDPFLGPRDLQFDQGIYWKGGIHWQGIFFDLHTGDLGRHPGVEVVGDISRDNLADSYVESNGFLHYITHFRRERSVMVFELESDYSAWSLKYRIHLERGPSVLSFVRGGESEEDSTFVLHEHGSVMAYKFREKSVEELIDIRDEAFYKEGHAQFASQSAFQFVETLALV